MSDVSHISGGTKLNPIPGQTDKIRYHSIEEIIEAIAEGKFNKSHRILKHMNLITMKELTQAKEESIDLETIQYREIQGRLAMFERLLLNLIDRVENLTKKNEKLEA